MEQVQNESIDYLTIELDSWDNQIKETFEKHKYENNASVTSNAIDLHDKDLSSLDLNTLFEAYKLIANRDFLTRQLLENELKSYTPSEKITDCEKIVELLHNYLSRYQKLICCNIFEDDGWCTNTGNSKFFDITENMTIVFNTVKRKLYNDKFLVLFMNNIVKLMKRSIEGFEISFKIIDDKKNNVCWALFKIKINLILDKH
jgi:hypothetical protein